MPSDLFSGDAVPQGLVLNEDQIKRPRIYGCRLSFKNLDESHLMGSLSEFSADLRKIGKFEGAYDELSNFAAHLKSKAFVCGLIWSDGVWCVLYDHEIRSRELFPGPIVTAYYHASGGHSTYPTEGRPRRCFSCGVIGF